MSAISRALRRSHAALQKRAWLLLFAFFAINVFRAMISFANPSFDYSPSLTGLTWGQIGSEYPGLAAFINGKLAESSIFLLGFGIFGMTLSAMSYRRGERWAWCVMWYTVVFVVGVMELAGGAISVIGLAPVMLAIVLLGLLVPFRIFFPARDVKPSAS